ncbi:MAG: hypothetical protein OXT06_18210 [Rhodospirillaceae bacterium]|nr:hypothetical protein [Rhodospirillaceae bacterium]MDD9916963.1 hypothetical protein [Rhodospirillaceae bacterium]MDD9924594.1 hypothetical protein [Rhodospirillaceae bacterium]
MNTQVDRDTALPGYYRSHWPVECGGNRRQKAAHGGLHAEGATPEVTTVTNGRWNVMTIWRGPDELYLGGTIPAFTGPPPFGWLQRLNPESLEVISESPRLPCGDHVWCGAIAAHANGSIYKVNGSYLHRLDPDCQVLAERKLPVDQAHNGLLILSDGSVATKDLRLAGQGPSTITRLSPDTLEVMGPPLALPEGSMGRIASDQTDAGEFIYIPGIERVWRIRVAPNELSIDDGWAPQYRTEGGEQGLSWDGCISEGALWLMDNGDIDSLRAIYGEHPNGRFDVPSAHLSWRRPAPWSGPQRLLKISLESGEVVTATPFGTPGGGIIAPPVNVPEHSTCIAWDSINGGLAGVATDETTLRVRWTVDARPSMQPVVFPETGELVINDYKTGDDQLIVVDIPTGEVISRVSLGSRVANGMFLTAGLDRDVYYCSTLAVSRVRWR